MREMDCKDLFEKWQLGDFRFTEARKVLAMDPGFSYAYFKGESGYAVVGGVRYKNKVYYSVSLCSPRDNFSKKDGKENVMYHFCNETSGNKRGMIELKEEELKERTGVILKKALDRFIERGRSVPYWAKHTKFSFMNNKNY